MRPGFLEANPNHPTKRDLKKIIASLIIGKKELLFVFGGTSPSPMHHRYCVVTHARLLTEYRRVAPWHAHPDG